jgi:hypothetical protein
MKLFSFIFPVLLCVSMLLHAQGVDVDVKHTTGEFDSTYIESYNSYFMPRFLLNRKYTAMRLENDKEDYALRYTANKIVNAGIGATYKFATLNISLAFVQPGKDRGRTRNLDIQLHSYGRKFAIDFIAQFYKGFFLRDQDYAPANEEYYVRPDLAINTVGGTFQYVFNHRKFSYRAAFQQTEWQRKSAGSFLLGFELYAGRFKGDSSLIPEQARNDARAETLQKMRFIEIGPNFGYAYTYVYKKFFVTGSAAVAINTGLHKFYDASGGTTVTGVSPNTIVRLSTGYNVRQWAINVLYISTAVHLPKLEDRSVVVNSGNIRMNLIYRIYPTKRIKKAVKLIDKVDENLKSNE